MKNQMKKNQMVQQHNPINNQSVNPRPRKSVKDPLNDRVRLFFKTHGSSILIAENLTIVAARILTHEITFRIINLGGKVNGNFYTVR